jgi:hypothetical protein
MKRIINRFLISAVSAFILTTNPSSLNAAFIEATPTTQLSITGKYTRIYLHGNASVKIGERLLPFDVNVTLSPEGPKTKLTVVCGEGEPRYIAGTPGVDRPKSFPAFLESDVNNLLQLEDPVLAADKKKTLHILTTYNGMPVMFALSLSNITLPVDAAAVIAPSLRLTGNGTERFAISSIVPKGGVFVAKGSAGQESPLPSLDFTASTKGDIIELFRGLARLFPATLAAFSIDTKTNADGTTVTTFTTTIKH